MRTAPAPIFCPMARPSMSEPRAVLVEHVPLGLRRLWRDCTVSGRACRMYSLPSMPSLAHSMSIGRP